jgi:predicted nuclease of predicted toxin-antitoxin system
MSDIALFLDEDVWLGLAVALRQRGFDAVHVYECERGGLSDPEQLAYAAQEGRAILTHNIGDFASLAVDYAFDTCSHSGIILSQQIEKGELLRRIRNLLRSLTAVEIHNAERYLSDDR